LALKVIKDFGLHLYATEKLVLNIILQGRYFNFPTTAHHIFLYTFQNMEKKEQIIQYIGGLSIGFCIGVCGHELIHNQEKWRKTLNNGMKNLKSKIPTNLKKLTNGNDQINKENQKNESKLQSRHTSETKNNKTDDPMNQLEVIETRAAQETRKTKQKQTGVKANTEKKGNKMQENSTANITQELLKTQGSKNIPPGLDIRDQTNDNKVYERETKSNEEALKLTVLTNQNPALPKILKRTKIKLLARQAQVMTWIKKTM